MQVSRISKNPIKKFRPVSCGLDGNHQMICICEGMFWTITIKAEDRHLIPVNNPHFRLILRPNFKLEGYLFGVIKSAWVINYIDIVLPSQVHHVKTEYVSRFH